MTTATIQPAAWRVSMGTTEDHNHWHYYGKKPKAIDDGEIWEPLYSASTLESLQRENEELRAALVAAKTRMRNCRGAIESDQVIDKDVHGSLQNGIRDIEAALASTGGDPLKAFDALVTGPSFTEIASTGGEHNGN